MARQLTEKQRRFVEAYMGEAKGNATEAARLAGYKGDYDTLRSVGSENLTKPAIRDAIDARVDNCPLVASRQDRLEFLTRVMLGQETDRMMTKEGPIDVEPAMRDRLKALELLGKIQGDFVQKVELKGEVRESAARELLELVAAVLGPEAVGKLSAALDEGEAEGATLQ